MDSPSALASPSFVKLVDTYKKAAATAASVTAYAVLARGMARELLPDDLCALVSWGASLLRARMEPPPVERCTVIVRRIEVDSSNCDDYNAFYTDVHDYLATRIDPRSMRRLRLSGGGASKVMSMDRGDSMTDLFEGVQFRWASVPGEGDNVRT